jgi:hypothetical protein
MAESNDTEKKTFSDRGKLFVVGLLFIGYLAGVVTGQYSAKWHAKSAAKNQTQKQAPTTVPKDVEVEWSINYISIKKKDEVDVFGEKAWISYYISFDAERKPNSAWLSLYYPKRDENDQKPDYVCIDDDNFDFIADGVNYSTYSSDGMVRRDANTQGIFAKADALLRRFRTELTVDLIIKQKPDPYDPFLNPAK